MNVDMKDPSIQYIVAKHLLKQLLYKGKITEEEFNRINEENRKNFEQYEQ